MPDTKSKKIRQIMPVLENLFYLPLGIAMLMSSHYALMVLALPILGLASYITACTAVAEYQQAKQLIGQFVFTIAAVYLVAGFHPSTGEFAEKVYYCISAIAFICWVYTVIKSYQAFRSQP